MGEYDVLPKMKMRIKQPHVVLEQQCQQNCNDAGKHESDWHWLFPRKELEFVGHVWFIILAKMFI